MRVLICGNYGRRTNPINGQTIKTRTLTEALASAFGDEAVSTLDTSTVFSSPWSFYRSARTRFAACTHVVLLPGPLAVHILVPLFVRWRRRRPADIRYVVIGGWLPDLLARRRALRRACQRVDGIYVEAEAMVASLRALGVTNAKLLPNFRLFDKTPPTQYRAAVLPLRLVFCARVLREKGIEEAIDAVGRVNAGRSAPVAMLDIYGPVAESYEERFRQVVGQSDVIQYRGVLQGSEMYATLRQYDLMLFPTFYGNEGFPGTILDSFVAGVPVLASDWNYNRELVTPGKTGELCAPRSSEDLTRILEGYIDAPERIAPMRRFCVEQSLRYHVDYALEGFIADLAAGAADELPRQPSQA